MFNNVRQYDMPYLNYDVRNCVDKCQSIHAILPASVSNL